MEIGELREHFAKDLFAADMGIEIAELSEGAVTCKAVAGPRHKNTLGRVQGGFLFTLADFTFAVAAHIHCPGSVTLEADIHFLAAPKGDVLWAKAYPRSLGGRVSVFRVEICDDTGQLVAEMTATGYAVRLPK